MHEIKLYTFSLQQFLWCCPKLENFDIIWLKFLNKINNWKIVATKGKNLFLANKNRGEEDGSIHFYT